jgi:hypothetical protein
MDRGGCRRMGVDRGGRWGMAMDGGARRGMAMGDGRRCRPNWARRRPGCAALSRELSKGGTRDDPVRGQPICRLEALDGSFGQRPVGSIGRTGAVTRARQEVLKMTHQLGASWLRAGAGHHHHAGRPQRRQRLLSRDTVGEQTMVDLKARDSRFSQRPVAAVQWPGVVSGSRQETLNVTHHP